MNWLVTVLAALAGGAVPGTVGVAWLNRAKIRAEASKTGADAAAVLTGSAMQLLERVQAELVETRADLDAVLVAVRNHTETIQALVDEQAPGVTVPPFRYPIRFARKEAG